MCWNWSRHGIKTVAESCRSITSSYWSVLIVDLGVQERSTTVVTDCLTCSSKDSCQFLLPSVRLALLLCVSCMLSFVWHVRFYEQINDDFSEYFYKIHQKTIENCPPLTIRLLLTYEVCNCCLKSYCFDPAYYMSCGWAVKAGMVCVWVAGETAWFHCYTQAISERSRDETPIIKCYINSSVYFTLLYVAPSPPVWRQLAALNTRCCTSWICIMATVSATRNVDWNLDS